MKEKKLYPAAITIFGAKGDLTHRKLIPAIYNLFIAKHLPDNFALFCVDFPLVLYLNGFAIFGFFTLLPRF